MGKVGLILNGSVIGVQLICKVPGDLPSNSHVRTEDKDCGSGESLISEHVGPAVHGFLNVVFAPHGAPAHLGTAGALRVGTPLRRNLKDRCRAPWTGRSKRLQDSSHCVRVRLGSLNVVTPIVRVVLPRVIGRERPVFFLQACVYLYTRTCCVLHIMYL